MNDFNFLLEPEVQIDQKPQPQFVGPNLNGVTKMTPKQFASSVLEVYNLLGGASWLLTEAKANPRAFLELLKKMIPSGIQMEDLHGFSIRLIDQFGNQIEIDASGGVPAIAPPPAARGDQSSHEPGQLNQIAPKAHTEIATGGNPQASEAEVNIQDTFDD